jgi:hypothetical protein
VVITAASSLDDIFLHLHLFVGGHNITFWVFFI